MIIITGANICCAAGHPIGVNDSCLVVIFCGVPLVLDWSSSLGVTIIQMVTYDKELVFDYGLFIIPGSGVCNVLCNVGSGLVIISGYGDCTGMRCGLFVNIAYHVSASIFFETCVAIG